MDPAIYGVYDRDAIVRNYFNYCHNAGLECGRPPDATHCEGTSCGLPEQFCPTKAKGSKPIGRCCLRQPDSSMQWTDGVCDGMKPIPVDCVVGDWTAWGDCTALSCEKAGTQTRTRKIIQPMQNKGESCPSLTQSKPCVQPKARFAQYNKGGWCGCYSDFTDGKPLEKNLGEKWKKGDCTWYDSQSAVGDLLIEKDNTCSASDIYTHQIRASHQDTGEACYQFCACNPGVKTVKECQPNQYREDHTNSCITCLPGRVVNDKGDGQGYCSDKTRNTATTDGVTCRPCRNSRCFEFCITGRPLDYCYQSCCTTPKPSQNVEVGIPCDNTTPCDGYCSGTADKVSSCQPEP